MTRSPRPLRVAVIGGGNGIPIVLRGLADEARNGRPVELAAIVATADDGGSSGRIRRERGGVPPGDLRNCLIALADGAEAPFGRLFAHRYEGAGALAGHSLGNLMLMALAERSGSWTDAVAEAGHMLGARGRVIPASPIGLRLEGETVDGERISGESRLGAAPSALRRVWLEPGSPEPSPGVLEALREADLVVLGPGSLFTSLVPVLLVHGVTDAIRASRGVRVLIANLMTQPGETVGMSLAEHLDALEAHAGPGLVEMVLVNDASIDRARLRAYQEQGSELVALDGLGARPEALRFGRLVNDAGKIRHDPRRLADALIGVLPAPGVARGRARTAPSLAPGGGSVAR